MNSLTASSILKECVIFMEILYNPYLVKSIHIMSYYSWVKTSISRNFCEKTVTVKLCNFHSVNSQNLFLKSSSLIPSTLIWQITVAYWISLQFTEKIYSMQRPKISSCTFSILTVFPLWWPPKWDFELEIRPEQAWTSKTSWIVVILYNLTCVAWPRSFQKVVNCQRRMPKCLGLFFGHSLLIWTSNCQKAFFKSLKGFFLL